MLPKDRELNIKMSFSRFIYEKLSANYYVNYTAPKDKKLGENIKARVEGYWKWIETHWLNVGPGIFCVAKVQVNCNTIIINDVYGVSLDEMADEVQEELNVDTIPLLDFSDDPEDPVAVDNVLIPRFRGSRRLPNAAGDTVNVKALTYDIYIWRESVLP